MVSTMYTPRIMAKARRVRFMTLFSLPIWSTVAQAATVLLGQIRLPREAPVILKQVKASTSVHIRATGATFFGGLAESEDAHQHHDDGAECHNKVEKFHDCLSLSVLMGGPLLCWLGIAEGKHL